MKAGHHRQTDCYDHVKVDHLNNQTDCSDGMEPSHQNQTERYDDLKDKHHQNQQTAFTTRKMVIRTRQTAL